MLGSVIGLAKLRRHSFVRASDFIGVDPRSRRSSVRSMIRNGSVVREVSENWWQEDESPVEYGK